MKIELVEQVKLLTARRLCLVLRMKSKTEATMSDSRQTVLPSKLWFRNQSITCFAAVQTSSLKLTRQKMYATKYKRENIVRMRTRYKYLVDEMEICLLHRLCKNNSPFLVSNERYLATVFFHTKRTILWHYFWRLVAVRGVNFGGMYHLVK